MVCSHTGDTQEEHRSRLNVCDLSHLNLYVHRERYQSCTLAQIFADIAATHAMYFTVLDTLKGYHQYSLDKESQPLTTFITLLADKSTSMPLTVSPLYQNIMSKEWLRHSQD